MWMELYAITRRHGWSNASELEDAAGRSLEVCEDEMTDRVRWIRSYVLEEGDGWLGTICLYAAVSPEAIRKHARLAGLPVEQIIRLSDTVIVPPIVHGHARRHGRQAFVEGWGAPEGAFPSDGLRA